MVKSPFPCEDSTRFKGRSQSSKTPRAPDVAGPSPAEPGQPVPGGAMSTQVPVPSARNEVRQVIPRLIELTETLLYPDIWERPGLSRRDRSLITVAALVAMYRPEQLKGHTERALANGVTKDEISELITHLAFYAGWPSAMSAARVVKQVFEEKKP